MQVDWEKCSLLELDITATDLSTECLQDMLTRLPGLRFLSAGQLNGLNDSVLKTWMEQGNPRNLVGWEISICCFVLNDNFSGSFGFRQF